GDAGNYFLVFVEFYQFNSFREFEVGFSVAFETQEFGCFKRKPHFTAVGEHGLVVGCFYCGEVFGRTESFYLLNVVFACREKKSSPCKKGCNSDKLNYFFGLRTELLYFH